METIVKTDKGNVKGFMRNGNAVFYCIPYGDRCDRERRFMAPQEAPAWEGVLDCTFPGGKKACQVEENFGNTHKSGPMHEIEMIFTGGRDLGGMSVTNDENCLNLSLVTPGIDSKKRPVIAYIHGGGFEGGSSYVMPAICDRLCGEEDVVVVSVEHRLGAFGFLYLGFLDQKYETSGINGLLDIILGLQWVQANIASFGGDPDNVTLYGESGGAMKISNLLSMPAAKGLFHRAYLNSGAFMAGIASRSDGERESLAFLKELGLTRENYWELFDKPVSEIIAAQKKAETMIPFVSWYPVADGNFLPYNEEKTFQTYECSKEVEVMAGSSEDEIIMLAFKPILSKQQLLKTLRSDCKDGMTFRPDLSDEEIRHMIDIFRHKDGHKRNYTHTYGFIRSQFLFLGYGAYEMAKVWAKAGRSFYLYKVSYDTPFLLPPFRSAWHTADLPLSFRSVYLPEHERISKDMAHFMCEFIRGKKVVSSGIEWKPFDLENKNTMVYDYQENHPVSDPDREIHELFDNYRASCR